MRKVLCALAGAALLTASLAGCSREYGDTDAYRAFIAAKSLCEPVHRTETSGDYTYMLTDGVLSFHTRDGDQIWCSDPYWFVDDFRLFDVDGDGNMDCLFSLWKSYSFYEGYDENDDPSVRNHLFLYTIRGGYAKSLWASSNLPRPIYRFEIGEGIQTPVSTGAVLKTVEGEYTQDDANGAEKNYRYTWQGWGFVPEDAPEPALQQSTSTVRLSFVGDLMVHTRQLYEAYQNDGSYDFGNSFASIRDSIAAADYAVGNLETVLGGEEIGYTDFPIFNTPDAFASALCEAGFDMVTTANNHCNDQGESGIMRTIHVLDSLGLDHIGTYQSQEARDRVFLKEIKGIKFAFLSCTYGTNGLPLTAGKPYLANIMSEQLIRDDIQRAKAENPDFVIVMPHMGDEYECQPGEVWQDWAHFMLDCGADIVIASHPHVLQPVEIVTNDSGDHALCTRLIAYSTGNFLSSQREPPADAGMILNLCFERDETGSAFISEVSYLPTWVKFSDASGGFDVRILPVCSTLNAAEKGEDVNLSGRDILRLKQVLKEQAALFLIEEPSCDAQGAYVIWSW
ncbi:MAG: CapA family protein [Oscillospiraceae bacterium]|nr:CapA family protein [Oscillospiraceae bacterium]